MKTILSTIVRNLRNAKESLERERGETFDMNAQSKSSKNMF